MFTGIIQEVGQVKGIYPVQGDTQLVFSASESLLKSAKLGDSIAVNGCCLTVTQLWPDSFAADVSRETLDVTTLKDWCVGQRINLEKALCVGDSLGGHYVSGHVDAVGEVLSRHEDARSVRMRFSAPRLIGRFIAKKGSIAVDGVSLTVNQVGDEAAFSWFEVNLVPHTLAVTILNHYSPSTKVNLEVDIIARYFERMQQAELTK